MIWVVNAVNLHSGGGYTILLNFYRHAPRRSIFLVKNEEIARGLRELDSDGPRLLVAPSWVGKWWGQLYFYLFWVGRLCKKVRAAELISLGNIASRVGIKQKLYLHWPYIAYDFSEGGVAGLKVNIRRHLRYAVIKFFSRYPDICIVQTAAMKKRVLEAGKIKVNSVFVVYPGFEHRYVEADSIRADEGREISCIYPALFYSHKNFGVLLKLAREIDRRQMIYTISLTLPEAIYSDLGFRQTRCTRNLGVLSKKELDFAYSKHQALIMPTKLETFGLPYLEALGCGIPILTSDRDFARDICKDYAIYFDPDDVDSIIGALEELRAYLRSGRDFHAESRAHLSRFPSWRESVSTVFFNPFKE